MKRERMSKNSIGDRKTKRGKKKTERGEWKRRTRTARVKTMSNKLNSPKIKSV